MTLTLKMVVEKQVIRWDANSGVAVNVTTVGAFGHFLVLEQLAFDSDFRGFSCQRSSAQEVLHCLMVSFSHKGGSNSVHFAYLPARQLAVNILMFLHCLWGSRSERSAPWQSLSTRHAVTSSRLPPINTFVRFWGSRESCDFNFVGVLVPLTGRHLLDGRHNAVCRISRLA